MPSLTGIKYLKHKPEVIRAVTTLKTTGVEFEICGQGQMALWETFAIAIRKMRDNSIA